MRQLRTGRRPPGCERDAEPGPRRVSCANRFGVMAVAINLAIAPAIGNAGQMPHCANFPQAGPATTQKAAETDRSTSRSLKVVTYNVRECRHGLNRIAAYLREQDADVVFLQELLRRGVDRPVGQAETLARLAGGYHWISGDTLGIDAERHCDVAILARVPLNVFKVHDAPPGGRVFAISATIERTDRPLRLMCVHTRSTARLTGSQVAESAGQRFAEIAALLEYVRGLDGDMLVVGDFNAASWMPEYQSLSRELTDLTPAASRGKATFPAFRPSLRIDYLFGRGDVTTVSYEVGNVRLSDHLPVIAELSLPIAVEAAVTSRPAAKPSDGDGKKPAASGAGCVNRKDGTSRRPDRQYDG